MSKPIIDRTRVALIKHSTCEKFADLETHFGESRSLSPVIRKWHLTQLIVHFYGTVYLLGLFSIVWTMVWLCLGCILGLKAVGSCFVHRHRTTAIRSGYMKFKQWIIPLEPVRGRGEDPREPKCPKRGMQRIHHNGSIRASEIPDISWNSSGNYVLVDLPLFPASACTSEYTVLWLATRNRSSWGTVADGETILNTADLTSET